MKKAFYILVFTFLYNACFSQDTIVLRNFKPFAGKIIGNSHDKVFMRLSKNNKIANIDKDDIAVIKYATGKVDTLNPGIYQRITANENPRLYTRRAKISYDTIYKPLQYGVGLEIGIVDLGDFDDFTKYVANYYHLTIQTNLGPVTTGGNIFIGARLNKTFDLKLLAGFTIVQRQLGVDANYASGYLSMSRTAFGLIGGYRVPIKPRIGFLLSGGVLYNSFQVWQNGFPNIFAGKDVGARLQGGINFFISRNVTVQALLGPEYALAKDRGFKMSFTGAILGINIVFAKLPFVRN